MIHLLVVTRLQRLILSIVVVNFLGEGFNRQSIAGRHDGQLPEPIKISGVTTDENIR
jgi:hypothetical protein